LLLSYFDKEVDMSNNKKRTPRLGRGLSSLMAGPVKVMTPEADAGDEGADVASGVAAPPPEVKQPEPETPAVPPPIETPARGYDPDPNRIDDPNKASETDGLVHLPAGSLEPNRHQPRQKFDEAALKRLADSIASEGIMQPIIARPSIIERGRYEIVAGERRWRAAQIAGLTSVPVIIRELNDRQIAEWALIENLQREDLNPIERAEAFARLIEQFGLSHEEAGKRVGIDRSSITNHLRMLGLLDPVKQFIREGLISMGQARALVGLSDIAQQQLLAERAVRQGLSVREVEVAVRKMNAGEPVKQKQSPKAKAAYIQDLEKQIGEQLGTKASIRAGRKKGSGTLSIEFYSLDQFDTLISTLGVKTD